MRKVIFNTPTYLLMARTWDVLNNIQHLWACVVAVGSVALQQEVVGLFPGLLFVEGFSSQFRDVHSRLASNSNLAVGVDLSLCAGPCDDFVAPLYLHPEVSWIGPWLQDKQWQKINTKQKTAASSSFSTHFEGSLWQAGGSMGQITQLCSHSRSWAWGFASSCKAVVPRFLISSPLPFGKWGLAFCGSVFSHLWNEVQHQRWATPPAAHSQMI